MKALNQDNQLGFTLIEIVVTLVIIGVVAAVLTPIVSSYVDQARVAQAQSDANTIGQAISRFQGDVGVYPMFSAGSGLLQDTGANIVTLQGPGNLPTVGGSCSNNCAAWTSATPTDADCNSNCKFGLLQDQLTGNVPGYATSANLGKPFMWKGPYLNPSADPWGNTYLANIIHCKSTSGDACFVLSAGPNGTVETSFDITKTNTITPTNDDIIYVIK